MGIDIQTISVDQARGGDIILQPILNAEGKVLLSKTARSKQRTRGHREAYNTKDGDIVLFFLVILHTDRKSKVVAAMLVCEDISEQTRLGKELL